MVLRRHATPLAPRINEQGRTDYLLARPGGRALAIRAAGGASGRGEAGQIGHQPVGRRAAAPDSPLRRPGDCRASQRFRPLSGQQGHRALPPRRRRLAGPALPSAPPARSRDRGPGAQRHPRGPVPRRHCGQAIRRPARRTPAILIPNPFYAAYGAGAAAADCEPVYLAATAQSGFLPDLDDPRRRADVAHGRALPRLAVQSAGRGRRHRLSGSAWSRSRGASAS